MGRGHGHLRRACLLLLQMAWPGLAWHAPRSPPSLVLAPAPASSPSGQLAGCFLPNPNNPNPNPRPVFFSIRLYRIERRVSLFLSCFFLPPSFLPLLPA
jgi:hypothetical protein